MVTKTNARPKLIEKKSQIYTKHAIYICYNSYKSANKSEIKKVDILSFFLQSEVVE